MQSDSKSPAAPREVARKAQSRWRSFSRRARWTLLVVVVLLIALRMALPFAVKAYVNRQLDNVPQYAGQIGDVDISLWRGAYQIHNVEILKTDGRIPVPFFFARTVDLSIEWRELFHGALVGEMILDAPKVNFVKGPTPEQTQTGEDRSWGETLESLFPFKINRLEIRNGQLHFQDFHSTPQVDIYVEQLQALATNLTNARGDSHDLPAGIQARATTLGGGDVDLLMQINPLAALPAFELNAQLTNVNLVALNDFLRAYGKFDVERGTFSLFASFASAEGKYDGYAKVFFENLDVFEWEKERKKNILQVFWQAIVGITAQVFRNHPEDQLATKIPISGSFEDQDVGVWTAAATLLRNAFISALVPKLDQTKTVEEVREAETQ